MILCLTEKTNTFPLLRHPLCLFVCLFACLHLATPHEHTRPRSQLLGSNTPFPVVICKEASSFVLAAEPQQARRRQLVLGSLPGQIWQRCPPTAHWFPVPPPLPILSAFLHQVTVETGTAQSNTWLADRRRCGENSGQLLVDLIRHKPEVTLACLNWSNKYFF